MIDWRGQHATYYFGLAQELVSQLPTPGDWLTAEEEARWERLRVEIQNLRAALSWYKESGDTEMGLRLAETLGKFWLHVGDWSGGRYWLKYFMDATRGSEALLAVWQSAVDWAGDLTRIQGDVAEAHTLYEESLRLREARSDTQGIAQSLSKLAEVAQDQGRYHEAQALLERSLVLRRELGDKLRMARLLNALGYVAKAQRRPLAALTHYRESLALRRELGDMRGVAWSLVLLAGWAEGQHDYALALTLYRQSLRMRWEWASQSAIEEGLIDVAFVAKAQGDFVRAARLFGAKEALAERRGISPRGVKLDRFAKHMANRLEERQVRAGWNEGRTMTLEQAVHYALDETGDEVRGID